MEVKRISHPTGKVAGHIDLDGSKSISNRVLIIKALCKHPFSINHLSTSDDTTTLAQLCNQKDDNVFDCHHAGTTFRFMAAYLAVQDGVQILTGSERMKQRPIGPLVDALINLGADIEYLENDGFPPLKIKSYNTDNYTPNIRVKADISSQYITALLLIAPTLPKGLVLTLEGELVSEPYLNMTLKTISEFGISFSKVGNKISIDHQEYQPADYVVEADWSACSYYYSIAALSSEANISLGGLFQDSIQGDSKIRDIGVLFGVESSFDDGYLNLTRSSLSDSIYYDFINQPDLVQTVAVMCAGLGVQGLFTGLKTLRIKETDRIAALQYELGKIGCTLHLSKIEDSQEYYEISGKCKFDSTPQFATYNDHRMAMSLAPLALQHAIDIEDPKVVSKSYPKFWEDLGKLGFMYKDVTP